MSLQSTFSISASGLQTAQTQMDLIANNVANLETTRTPNGGPYRAESAVLESMPNNQGVRVAGVATSSQTIPVYEPSHPDANAQGYVAYPAVDLSQQMGGLLLAKRVYEANLRAMQTENSLSQGILMDLTA